MRETTAERGFTLIELMMVVAIIAVLAIIVVPTFVGEARKAKGQAEVNAMFTAISTKQETYKNEFNSYLALPMCPTTGPSVAGANIGKMIVDGDCDAAWVTARVAAPESKMHCAYTVVVGAKGTTLTPPTGFKNSQGVAAAEPTLASGWWYATAECDEDGQGGTNAMYYESSVDTNIQVTNAAK
ncbi:MAG TPA: type II secretion system protein [Kofleriaceae bacterium]|nr:type II secretion system protein [Kofleriaceae bacterium]